MKLDYADIEWLPDGQLRSRTFDDVYFSRVDAPGESRHVFLAGNDLPERWGTHPGEDYAIAEMGFGAGLNFLTTWHAWRQATNKPARLYYLSFEAHPLRPTDLQRIHAQWPELAPLAELLQANYPANLKGCHRIILDDVCLDLVFADAREYLGSCDPGHRPLIDSWYLDGFKPQSNPALWNADLVHLIAGCSHAHTTLSSYSVAAAIRQPLLEAGFTVEKRPGHGPKRHMLHATYTDHDPVPAQNKPGRVAIIGAGLAGLFSAAALARRGAAVDIYERGPKPMTYASGIGSLILRCRLFKTSGTLAEFYVRAYLFALRQLRQLALHDKLDWYESGALLLDSSFPRPGHQFDTHYPEQILRRVDLNAASEIAGLPLLEAGYYLPCSGWLDPGSLATALINHERINLHTNAEIKKLIPENDTWRLISENKSPPIDYEAVIIANSVAANDLGLPMELPLQTVRGQLSTIPATATSAALKAIICGKRNLLPARQDTHVLGSSYQRKYDNLLPDQLADAESLALMGESIGPECKLGSPATTSRVAIRSNGLDHLPLIGATTQQGLYVSIAHGSSGLATTPIAGELLASEICGEALPVSDAEREELSPQRFARRTARKSQE